MGAGATAELRSATEDPNAESNNGDHASSSDLDESDWVKVSHADVISMDALDLLMGRDDEPHERNQEVSVDAAAAAHDVDELRCVGFSPHAEAQGTPTLHHDQDTKTSKNSARRLRDGLDESAFPLFGPLLKASQAYASHSGFRFRSSDLEENEGMTENEGTSEDQDEATAGLSPAVKQQLAPFVSEFSERLRSAEASLVEELSRAYEIVMMESVRNAMVAAFHELNLWPPVPSPDVAPDDCDYQDLMAPIPVIAQRLYNEENLRRRYQDAADGGGHGLGQRFRQAMTASFIVDFAFETGAGSQASTSKTDHVIMLEEFQLRVMLWEEEKSAAAQEAGSTDTTFPMSASPSSRSSFSSDTALEEFNSDPARWWSEPFSEAFWMVTSSVLIGAAATAGIMLVRKSKLHEEQFPDAEGQDAKEHGVTICAAASGTAVPDDFKDNICETESP